MIQALLNKNDSKVYPIIFEDFYKNIPDICQREITQLIERYEIFKKDILSIGAGAAFEEYWFAKLGDNNLTMIDIDENHVLEESLKTIALKLPIIIDEKIINYYIGDFLKFEQQLFENKFDMLYYSSFTPDELRRGEIMARVRATGIQDEVNLNWPAKEQPLHPVVEKSLKFIKNKGFFILQSYCSGIDLQYNPAYVNNLREQLLNHGLQLIDIYCFIEAPAVNLFVAYKGSKEEAKDLYKKIKNKEITQFHGRAAISNRSKKIYSYY